LRPPRIPNYSAVTHHLPLERKKETRMRRPSFVLLALAVLVVTLPLLAQSQATTGVIEGTIVDASGGAVPGVTVTVKNTGTGYESISVTDSGGRFRAVLLPVGPYQLSAVLQGFATAVRKGIDLGVGQTLTVNITLKQAATAEEIVVTAAPPLIETARTEGSTRVDEKAMEGLPNNGRNFLEFTKLTPGVTIVQGPDGDELSINGQKGISNNVSVDARTSTTRSSASSAAASGLRSRSISMRSRRWSSSPTVRAPSSAAPCPASSTSSPSRARTTPPAPRT
jgi:hypothetical protein